MDHYDVIEALEPSDEPARSLSAEELALVEKLSRQIPVLIEDAKAPK